MHLKGHEGTELRLDIRGYQFPTNEGDGWDANWLVVEIEATCEEGRWERTDPRLTVAEAQDLVAWLQSIAEDSDPPHELEFTEPNLRFHWELVDSGNVQVRVYFELEVRPPWSPSDAVGPPDFWINITVSRDRLLAASHALGDQLRRFPARGYGS